MTEKFSYQKELVRLQCVIAAEIGRAERRREEGGRIPIWVQEMLERLERDDVEDCW